MEQVIKNIEELSLAELLDYLESRDYQQLNVLCAKYKLSVVGSSEDKRERLLTYFIKR